MGTEAIIATAKKNRAEKIKRAKDKAEDDLKAFREERESQFQQELKAKAAADPTAALVGVTQREVDAVHRDFEQNKARTIRFVIDKVLDVPTTLTLTQMAALRTGVV